MLEYSVACSLAQFSSNIAHPHTQTLTLHYVTTVSVQMTVQQVVSWLADSRPMVSVVIQCISTAAIMPAYSILLCT